MVFLLSLFLAFFSYFSCGQDYDFVDRFIKEHEKIKNSLWDYYTVDQKYVLKQIASSPSKFIEPELHGSFGKTLIINSVAKALLEQGIGNKNIIILAPTRLIIENIKNTLTNEKGIEALDKIAIDESLIITPQGKSGVEDIKESKGKVIIVTLSTFLKILEQKGLLQKKAAMLFYDESHYVGRRDNEESKNVEMQNRLKKNDFLDLKIMGLSATQYVPGPNDGENYSPFQRVFGLEGENVHKITVDITQGYLNKSPTLVPNLYCLTVEVGNTSSSLGDYENEFGKFLTEQRAPRQEIGDNRKFFLLNLMAFEEFIENEITSRIKKGRTIEEREYQIKRDGGVVIHVNNKYQMLFAAEVLKEKFGENSVGMIHSDITDHKSQKRIVSKFLTGEIKVIIGAALITTGVNIPNATMVVNLSSTKSVVTTKQLLYRVVRAFEGKDIAYALQFVYKNSAYNEIVKKAQSYYFSDFIGPGVTHGLGELPKVSITSSGDSKVKNNLEENTGSIGPINSNLEFFITETSPSKADYYSGAKPNEAIDVISSLSQELDLSQEDVAKKLKGFIDLLKERYQENKEIFIDINNIFPLYYGAGNQKKYVGLSRYTSRSPYSFFCSESMYDKLISYLILKYISEKKEYFVTKKYASQENLDNYVDFESLKKVLSLDDVAARLFDGYRSFFKGEILLGYLNNKKKVSVAGQDYILYPIGNSGDIALRAKGGFFTVLIKKNIYEKIVDSFIVYLKNKKVQRGYRKHDLLKLKKIPPGYNFYTRHNLIDEIQGKKGGDFNPKIIAFVDKLGLSLKENKNQFENPLTGKYVSYTPLNILNSEGDVALFKNGYKEGFLVKPGFLEGLSFGERVVVRFMSEEEFEKKYEKLKENKTLEEFLGAENLVFFSNQLKENTSGDFDIKEGLPKENQENEIVVYENEVYFLKTFSFSREKVFNFLKGKEGFVYGAKAIESRHLSFVVPEDYFSFQDLKEYLEKRNLHRDLVREVLYFYYDLIKTSLGESDLEISFFPKIDPQEFEYAKEKYTKKDALKYILKNAIPEGSYFKLHQKKLAEKKLVPYFSKSFIRDSLDPCFTFFNNALKVLFVGNEEPGYLTAKFYFRKIKDHNGGDYSFSNKIKKIHVSRHGFMLLQRGNVRRISLPEYTDYFNLLKGKILKSKNSDSIESFIEIGGKKYSVLYYEQGMERIFFKKDTKQNSFAHLKKEYDIIFFKELDGQKVENIWVSPKSFSNIFSFQTYCSEISPQRKNRAHGSIVVPNDGYKFYAKGGGSDILKMLNAHDGSFPFLKNVLLKNPQVETKDFFLGYDEYNDLRVVYKEGFTTSDFKNFLRNNIYYFVDYYKNDTSAGSKNDTSDGDSKHFSFIKFIFNKYIPIKVVPSSVVSSEISSSFYNALIDAVYLNNVFTKSMEIDFAEKIGKYYLAYQDAKEIKIAELTPGKHFNDLFQEMFNLDEKESLRVLEKIINQKIEDTKAKNAKVEDDKVKNSKKSKYFDISTKTENRSYLILNLQDEFKIRKIGARYDISKLVSFLRKNFKGDPLLGKVEESARKSEKYLFDISSQGPSFSRNLEVVNSRAFKLEVAGIIASETIETFFENIKNLYGVLENKVPQEITSQEMYKFLKDIEKRFDILTAKLPLSKIIKKMNELSSSLSKQGFMVDEKKTFLKTTAEVLNPVHLGKDFGKFMYSGILSRFLVNTLKNKVQHVYKAQDFFNELLPSVIHYSQFSLGAITAQRMSRFFKHFFYGRMSLSRDFSLLTKSILFTQHYSTPHLLTQGFYGWWKAQPAFIGGIMASAALGADPYCEIDGRCRSYTERVVDSYSHFAPASFAVRTGAQFLEHAARKTGVSSAFKLSAGAYGFLLLTAEMAMAQILEETDLQGRLVDNFRFDLVKRFKEIKNCIENSPHNCVLDQEQSSFKGLHHVEKLTRLLVTYWQSIIFHGIDYSGLDLDLKVRKYSLGYRNDLQNNDLAVLNQPLIGYQERPYLMLVNPNYESFQEEHVYKDLPFYQKRFDLLNNGDEFSQQEIYDSVKSLESQVIAHAESKKVEIKEKVTCSNGAKNFLLTLKNTYGEFQKEEEESLGVVFAEESFDLNNRYILKLDEILSSEEFAKELENPEIKEYIENGQAIAAGNTVQQYLQYKLLGMEHEFSIPLGALLTQFSGNEFISLYYYYLKEWVAFYFDYSSRGESFYADKISFLEQVIFEFWSISKEFYRGLEEVEEKPEDRTLEKMASGKVEVIANVLKESRLITRKCFLVDGCIDNPENFLTDVVHIVDGILLQEAGAQPLRSYYEKDYRDTQGHYYAYPYFDRWGRYLQELFEGEGFFDRERTDIPLNREGDKITYTDYSDFKKEVDGLAQKTLTLITPSKSEYKESCAQGFMRACKQPFADYIKEEKKSKIIEFLTFLAIQCQSQKAYNKVETCRLEALKTNEARKSNMGNLNPFEYFNLFSQANNLPFMGKGGFLSWKLWPKNNACESRFVPDELLSSYQAYCRAKQEYQDYAFVVHWVERIDYRQTGLKLITLVQNKKVDQPQAPLIIRITKDDFKRIFDFVAQFLAVRGGQGKQR